MAVVIVDNEGSNAHSLRHVGRGHERREWRELVPEMVRDEVVPDQKGRVPQLLGPARVGVPGAGRLHAFIDHTEAEGTRWSHVVPPPLYTCRTPMWVEGFALLTQAGPWPSFAAR